MERFSLEIMGLSGNERGCLAGGTTAARNSQNGKVDIVHSCMHTKTIVVRGL